MWQASIRLQTNNRTVKSPGTFCFGLFAYLKLTYNKLVRAYKKNKISGFTLTEVLLLLSLVGVILAGVLPIFLNVITANKRNELYSRAYKDLDTKIEEIRYTNFDSIAPEANFSVVDLPSGRGTVSVVDAPGGVPNLKQVTVIIYWDFKGTKNIKATTLVTRGGIK